MEQNDITNALLFLHRNVARYLKKEQVFKRVVLTIRQLVRCDGCAILMVENGNIVVAAQQGFYKNLQDAKFKISDGPIKYIVSTGRNLYISDVTKSRFKSCMPEGCRMKSIICVPIKIDGNVSGVIHLNSKRTAAFKKQDVDFIKLISSELSSIIERSLLYSEVEQLSIKDHLTGYFNKRNLYYDLNKKIEECKRYKKIFSIIMIDIDNFKKYNDRFGHSAGDALLKFICRHLRKMLRKADITYRYGGDEFVVLLPETKKEGARVCAGRLEEYVRNMNKKIDKDIRITLSTGVAGYPEDASTAVSLIKFADRQMYKNKFLKKAGR
ncbi:MAG: sensor domain-containing diguanylate cyclase [Candidatus Omnitrophica bacterium]|nr:sensor domain-containing diguanylate cyclase [Candidatus Omnitrophota bacterium]MCM8829029.1 sensor domain-containing diguanylate cyclase [Candidatus Omnitrophota bacterium]